MKIRMQEAIRSQLKAEIETTVMSTLERQIGPFLLLCPTRLS